MENLKQSLSSALGTTELGKILTKAVNQTSKSNNVKEADIIQAMAKESGVQVGTVNLILKGKIKKPPMKRIDDFIAVLTKSW